MKLKGSALTEKGGEMLLIGIGAVVILTVAFLALGGSNLIKMPGAGFFDFLGRTFEFMGGKVGLVGQQARDLFCTKSVNELKAMCAVSNTDLYEYCAAPELLQIGMCETPSENMKKFCEEPISEKEWDCKNQNEFNSFCDNVDKMVFLNQFNTIKDLPFCK